MEMPLKTLLKRCLAVAGFLLCTHAWVCPAAESANLVRNPGFEADAEGDGQPDAWQCRNPATGTWLADPAQATQHYVELRKDDEKADSLWMQRDLPLLGGRNYVVQYSAKASVTVQYRLYLEWSKTDGSYGSSTVGVADWQNGADEWQRRMFSFALPTDSSAPYLVLQLKAAGSVRFDDISVREPFHEPSAPGTVFSSSFEGGTTAWSLTPGAEIVEGEAAAGKAMLRLASTKKGVNAKAFTSGPATEPGKRYRLTFAARAGGGTEDLTGFQYFRVQLGWQRLIKDGVDHGEVQQIEGEAWQDCLASWQRRSLEFTVPAKPTAGMTITCEVRGPGTVFLDDLALTECAAAPETAPAVALRLDRPGYRETIFASLPVEAIAGSVAVADPRAEQVLLSLEGEGGKALFSQTQALAAGRAAFAIPARDLGQGSYTLRAKALAADQTLLGEAVKEIEKLAPSPVEVIVREDNVTIDSGKPFFPIGLWACTDSEKALSEVSAAGFNLIYRTSVTPAILDRFARYHLKAVAGIRYALPATPEGRRIWEAEARRRVGTTREHPALLGYFLIDEPLWGGYPLEQLLEVYRFHRQLDPYRPIWSNEAPRGLVADVAQYGQACDITGVDIYPVPEGVAHSEMADKTLSAVGKYADKMRASVSDRKPVWMALQGFAWKHLDDPKAKDAVYPTWEQSRFMAYDAILHGATGITYWGTHYIYEPEFWSVLFRVTAELRDLSTVLVAPTVTPAVIKTAAAEIVFLHKECDGQGYLLAANDGKQVCEATFSVPFTQDLHVLFENRTVSVRNGAFTDTFGANAVHVYATTAQPPPPLVPAPSLDPAPAGEGLREAIATQLALVPYRGTANWIWYPGLAGVADSACFLRRSFTVPAAVRSAELLVTADDEYVLYLNGTAVPTGGTGWSRAEKLSITALLRPGRNVFAVQAKDAGAPPCGFLLDIAVTLEDGQTFTLVSDADWRTQDQAQAGWEKAEFEDTAWRPAEVVAPYGGGAWGTRLLVHEAADK
jgi:hypothetical protein